MHCLFLAWAGIRKKKIFTKYIKNLNAGTQNQYIVFTIHSHGTAFEIQIPSLENSSYFFIFLHQELLTHHST